MDEPPPDIPAWRRAKRAELMAARLALPAVEHRRLSQKLNEVLEAELIEVLRRRLLGFYWPIRREFDPLPFVRRLLDAGGAAALPAVVEKNRPLEFRPWSPGTPMAVGVYDIPYPAAGPAVHPDALLVPLLGFDAAGYRLGYGGGYYDRTLGAASPRPFAVGVGFELGRLATIFPQAHDIPMDIIATEAGATRFC